MDSYALYHSKVAALFDRLDFDSSEPGFSLFDPNTQYFLAPASDNDFITLSDLTEGAVRDLFLSLAPLAVPAHITPQNGLEWLRLTTMIDILYGIHLQYAQREQVVPEMAPLPRVSIVGEDEVLLNIISTRNDMGFVLEQMMQHALSDYRVTSAAESEGINLYEGMKLLRLLVPFPHLTLIFIGEEEIILDAWLGEDNFIASGVGWERMQALLWSAPNIASSDKACHVMEFLLKMYQDLLHPATRDRLTVNLDNYRKLWP